MLKDKFTFIQWLQIIKELNAQPWVYNGIEHYKGKLHYTVIKNYPTVSLRNKKILKYN